MAKKSKRQARRPVSTVSTTTAAESTRTSVRSIEREFNPDYSPVIKDLKRIGMLAGSFFVILIVLSFFLN